MLTIITRDGNEYTWHVNQKDYPQLIIPYVVEVQADGDELAFIVDKFVNVRYRLGVTVARFFDTDARTIAGNLSSGRAV